MKIGLCKLCREEKLLINQSHIISNFFYKKIIGDDKEKAGFLISIPDATKGKPVYTGEFEGHILCEDCDNRILGAYESYGAKLIFGDGTGQGTNRLKWQNEIHPDGKLKSTFLTGVDYKNTKLFLLSLLWRSSISTRPFFKQVNLGKYEEEIRQMLLSADPGDEMQFPCFVGIFKDRNATISKQMITTPTKFKLDGRIVYQFQIGRLVLMYFVSKGQAPEYVKEIVVNKNEEMRVVHVEGEIADKHVRSLLGGRLHDHLINGIHVETNPTDLGC